MNADKLAKLQASVRIGGKGTPRRKVKRVQKSSGGDDKQVQAALKKLNVQPIPGIEEVNLFREDSSVIHITQPTVQAAVTANTFCISGHVEEKELADLVPGILNQLGRDSIENLRRLAELYQSKSKAAGGAANEDDADIPDLVGNFDEVTATGSE